MTPGSFGHVDIVWEDPVAALFLRTLASFSQVIRFDRRGTGASDPVPLEQLPPWESYAEDLDVVLDQVGAERTAVMAAYDTGPMAMSFAAQAATNQRAHPGQHHRQVGSRRWLLASKQQGPGGRSLRRTADT
jgi:pimeloyl-ACP methyl ester carboxylesterase